MQVILTQKKYPYTLTTGAGFRMEKQGSLNKQDKQSSSNDTSVLNRTRGRKRALENLSTHFESPEYHNSNSEGNSHPSVSQTTLFNIETSDSQLEPNRKKRCLASYPRNEIHSQNHQTTFADYGSSLSTQEISNTSSYQENCHPPSNGDGNESLTKCSICFNTSRCKKMNILLCGHSFHVKCINHWLRSNGKCPTCQKSSGPSSSGESNQTSFECSVCMDTSRCRVVEYLPCGHNFHKKCIYRWFWSNGECPVCQKISHSSSNGEHNESPTKCVICLDTFNYTKVKILPCKHSFHKRCIRQWLQSSDKCPVCQESSGPPSSGEDDKESPIKCAVCVDTTKWKRMKYLPCGHGFHKKCINRWLRLNDRCPICRCSIGQLDNVRTTRDTTREQQERFNQNSVVTWSFGEIATRISTMGRDVIFRYYF